MEDNKLQSIIILENSVKVLDQLLIPHETKYIDINNTQDAWKVIKEMKVRGAPLIAVVALQGLRMELINIESSELSELKNFLKLKTEYLKTSRPTAVNLANDLDNLIIYTDETKDHEKLKLKIIEYINHNYLGYERSCSNIAKNGADIILSKIKKSEISVLTICNTGKLATPGIGTALGIIREIHSRGKLKNIYIPETRPYNQGSRLTSYETICDNLPGILISDSMAGSLMQNGRVDCVIVGADRVTKTGYTANKIGTFTLSVLAKFYNIPFYVACPMSTIDMNMISGKDIIIEERPADELRKINGNFISPANINVWNPCFDITPPNLIESIITENGAYEIDKNYEEWEYYNNEKLISYLVQLKFIENVDDVTITDVADGNLNYVYCVKTKNKSICVKQALPYVKCIGTSWPLSLKRILYESEGLIYENEVCPDLVPKFIHFDENRSILIMEFLLDHIILRNGMIQGMKYNNIGLKLANFIAKTCFFSSGLFLNSDEIRKKISFWNGNTLCTLTEKVVFSDPYIDSQMNRWSTPQLDDYVYNIRKDKLLITKVYELRHKFIYLKQALIHGDLHSGSIMVKDDSCKIIDSEFSFYGPIGYDTGNVLAHFLTAYLSQTAYGNCQVYKEWILNEIKVFWNSFYSEWIILWDNKGLDEFPDIKIKEPEIYDNIKKLYMKKLFIDTIGYAGTEIIRRIIGVAHIAEFENINEVNLKSKIEIKSLRLGIQLIVESENFENIEDIINLVKSIDENN